MSYVNRIPTLSPARVYHLVALCVVAGVSFSLGLAAAPLSRRLALQTTLRQPVAQAPATAPAITGARYDAGWAGGPGAGAVLGNAPTTRAVSHPVALLTSARHPRPEELVRLPLQIQDQVAAAVLTPAAVFSDGEILTLPQQIQEQVRQAHQAPTP